MRKKFPLAAFVAATLALSACSGMGTLPAEDQQDPINAVLDKIVCQNRADPQCSSYFRDVPDDAAKTLRAEYFRLLRGHVVVAGLARLGAERIKASPDPQAEAFRILQGIQGAEADLKQSLGVAASKSRFVQAYYPVARTDALLSVVQLANAATHPSRRRMLDVLFGGKVAALQEGPAILENAIKDLAYLQGYRFSLLREIGSLGGSAFPVDGSGAADFQAAWAQYDGEIRRHCATLAEVSGVGNFDCLNAPASLAATSSRP